jgi:hypothetical protein|tara:strand:- start:63 stop:353 length:291 start_codon:yes stop_codon:yes gene_type:complete
MFTVDLTSSVGNVMVQTTSKRGFRPEELAVDCTNQIVSIASTADPIVRQQAEAFKGNIESVVLSYIQQGARSERTTIYNILLDAGEKSLAEKIRRL